MLEVIRKCSLFDGIDEQDLPQLLELIGAKIICYKRSELIFSQTDKPSRTMVLLEGSVAICNDSISGKRNVVALFNHAGELFGEVFVFLGKENYGNYAQAMTNVRILEIPKEAFTFPSNETSELRGRMIANMMTILAQKAYYLNQRLQVVSCVTLRQKIAKFLLQKSNLQMSREELADFLATTRPSLSRELMKMQDDGLIRIEGRSIKPLDIEGLQNIL